MAVSLISEIRAELAKRNRKKAIGTDSILTKMLSALNDFKIENIDGIINDIIRQW